MATREVKIGGFQQDNNGTTTVSPGKRLQASVCKPLSSTTGCLVCKIFLFGLLCAVIGALMTICLIAPPAPLDESIHDAVERCFQHLPINACEQHYTEALGRWYLGEDKRHVPFDEAKLVAVLNWQQLNETARRVDVAVTTKHFGDIAKSMKDMFEHLRNGLRQL